MPYSLLGKIPIRLNYAGLRRTMARFEKAFVPVSTKKRNVPAMEAAFVSVSDRALVPLTVTLTLPAILRPSAYNMNGADLPVAHGAPLRLHVEQQLGCKHVEYLVRIEVADSFASIGLGKGGFWEDPGYEWYAGI